MNFQTTLRKIAVAAALSATLGFTTVAIAQEFPTQEIRIINPSAPGGATDTAIRGLTANADNFIDQSILIESVTGGGGVTGILRAANANPDGHTLLVVDTVITTLPLFQENVPVGAEDFKPIGVFNLRGAWFLTMPEKGWNTMADFVAAAKAAPGELTVGVPALSSVQHMAIIAIEDTFDVDVNIIPYGGGSPTMAALLGNQIDAAMPGAPKGVDSVNAGDVVLLAASTELVIESLDGELMTFNDVGIPHDLGIWTAVWAPKDTPADTLQRLGEIFEGMATSQEWTDFATNYGVTPIWYGLEDAEAYIAASAQSMASLASLIE